MKSLPAVLAVVAGLVYGQPAARTLLSEIQSELNAGRYSQAFTRGAAAVADFRKSGDQSSLIRALTLTGLAQMYSGKYDPALVAFREARALSAQLHDLEYEITSWNNIGTVQYFTGRYEDAMEAYRAATALVDAASAANWLASRRQLTIANTAILYQTLGQNERALELYNGLLNGPQALPTRERAQLLANVGVLRRRLGDPPKALETYRAAQALYGQSGNSDGEIAILNNIGILQAMDFKDYGAAAHTFSQAIERSEKSGDRPLVIQARLYRGETYFRAGKLAESAADFGAAAEEAAHLGESEETWKADFGLARILLLQHDRSGGLALLRRAVDLIESMRADLEESSLRSRFLADKRDVYDVLIENSSRPEEVFRFMEQSRARSLTDRVARAAPAGINAIARLLPEDTALLEYWVGRSSMKAIWITSHGSGMRTGSLGGDLNRAFAEAPAALANPGRADWLQAVRPLAGPLLAGIDPLQDSGIRHLIVIPDRQLSALPFEALPWENGLLVERFAISYLPAAALLSRVKPPRPILWFWQPAVKAFADPKPGAGRATTPVGPEEWASLPDAHREIEEIGRVLPGREELYFAAAASKRQLETPSAAPILHLATHAFLDLENPASSYILLAPNSPQQRYDYLFLNEAADLPLHNVRLVTLSACDTGAGRDIPGEGAQSFMRAFLAAGVPSVITSLWAVGDRASSRLMIGFYSYLGRGESIEDAMRDAKVDFLRNPALAHPARWASFVVNGDGRALAPYVIGYEWLLAPVAIIAALITLRSWARRAPPYPELHPQVTQGSGQPR